MASIWDLPPLSAWPVQPIVWPTDPMQPAPGAHQAAPASPGFGWATLSPEEAKALSDLLQQNQIPNPNYVKAVKPPKK